MDVNKAVLDALRKSGKAMKSGELAEQSGLDKKDVDKALKELKRQGLIESPKVCYYAITK
jgi:DNA-binding IclR family transcriptional regulator